MKLEYLGEVYVEKKSEILSGKQPSSPTKSAHGSLSILRSAY